jgi:pimeloyl-ACP methyl ester carboxylesterase
LLDDGFVEVGGARLEVRCIAGRAPTIVMLHEGLGCVALWKDFPQRLARATGLSVLVYSRQGYGRSDPVALPRPVDFMHHEARHVLPGLLDVTGVEDAILFGHSDGGSIALIHAASFPRSSVRGVIAEAPHVFVEEISIESIESAGLAYREGDLRPRLARYHGDNVDGAFWGWNRVWLDPDFRDWSLLELLPEIRVPLLIIQGADDAYGTLAQVRAIEDGTGGPCTSLVLSDCGHAPHVEQSDTTLRAVADQVEDLLATGYSDS